MDALKLKNTSNGNKEEQQQGFLAFFRSLPKKPATTIRFFSHTEFYTLHGADAIFAAEEVYKSTSLIKMLGSEGDRLESILLNKINFESFLKNILLEKQCAVEIYCNKANSKGSSNWVLEAEGSPGNLSQFENILFDSVDNVDFSCVAAIKLGNKNQDKVVGLALVDPTNYQFSVCEFTDDDHFSNLEAFVIQHDIKECLVPDGCCENAKKVVSRHGILVFSRKNSEFSTDELAQDLNRLLCFKKGQMESALALPEMSLTLATSALSAAIKYLELPSSQDNSSRFSLCTFEPSKFVYINASAAQALNIVPESDASIFAKHYSILGLIDRCKTVHGHRLLSQWIKQPSCDINRIEERLDIVETLIEDGMLRMSLHDEHLCGIPDIQALSKKLQSKKANLQDCYRVYHAITKLPDLLTTLKSSNSGEPNPVLSQSLIKPLMESYSQLISFQELMQSTIDFDSIDKGEFFIKSEFDPTLEEYRSQMATLEERMKKELSVVANDLDLQAHKTVKLESNTMYGFFFKVTLREGKMVTQSKDKSFVVLDSSKGGVRFRTKKLDAQNSEYLKIRESYSSHQESIVSDVVSTAATFSHVLQTLSLTLAQLDVLCSFATVAQSSLKPFVRPKMHPKGTGILSMKQVRHPCLEVEATEFYVPNDIHFKQGESSFKIITGPNMGGKSTYIRSVGVAAFLAHIGCFVPCDSAEISVLDAILARMGAHDSQLKGMSTFMVEMVETATILKKATSDSLVIIDELGRGTSTYDGSGIAWAIIEHLVEEIKAFSLFATHFHELTRLADKISTIENLHVTALVSDGKLSLLYKVEPGICDQSFGIQIATMTGFPGYIIDDAKEKLRKLDGRHLLASKFSETDRKRLMEEGDKALDNFVAEMKKLKTQQLSDEEKKTIFEKCKNDLLSNKNAYLEALIH